MKIQHSGCASINLTSHSSPLRRKLLARVPISKFASTFPKMPRAFFCSASPRLTRHHRRQPRIDCVMVRIVLAILLPGAPLAAAGTTAPSTNDLAWVNLREIAPTIRIELRYATARNITHSPLYPCGMQPMVRGGVARCLIAAEKTLRRYNCGLKIWDAYRPRGTQARLWKLAPNQDYLADPQNGSGSLHSWGVAVDATIVDEWGQALSMPTDFDDFTPASMFHYPALILQSALTFIYCRKR